MPAQQESRHTNDTRGRKFVDLLAHFSVRCLITFTPCVFVASRRSCTDLRFCAFAAIENISCLVAHKPCGTHYSDQSIPLTSSVAMNICILWVIATLCEFGIHFLPRFELVHRRVSRESNCPVRGWVRIAWRLEKTSSA